MHEQRPTPVSLETETVTNFLAYWAVARGEPEASDLLQTSPCFKKKVILGVADCVFEESVC